MGAVPQELSVKPDRHYSRIAAIGLGITALGVATGATTYILVGQSYDKTVHDATSNITRLQGCVSMLDTLPGYQASTEGFIVNATQLTPNQTKQCGLQNTVSQTQQSYRLVGNKALPVKNVTPPNHLLASGRLVIPGRQTVQHELKSLHQTAVADRSSQRDIFTGLGTLPGLFFGLLLLAGAKNDWQGMRVF